MSSLLKKFGMILILILAINNSLFAQFEDEFEEEDTIAVKCIPDTLTTPYDKIAAADSTADVRMLYNYGYEHYKNKSYADALPYLWKVFILNKDEKRSKLSIGKIADIYFKEKKIDSTLIACYRGLERFPNRILLHYYAGFLQDKLGRASCAIPHYEILVKNDSTNVGYLKTLAKLYFTKDDERCIKIQERVVALKPDDANESSVLAKLKDHFYGAGAGIEAYKQAYVKNPSNLKFALIYGEAAVNAGNYKDAIEPLTKVIKEKPTVKAYKLRSEAYEGLNQTHKSIEDLKQILKIDVTRVSDMVFIAQKYGSKNQFSSAKYWINKALKAKPGFGAAYIALGELYEASVAYCQGQRNGKAKFEDKLVYEKAKNAYLKAAKDPAYKGRAKQKLKYLAPFLPTKEDRFMHKNSKITSPCYKWLK
jgi:tetratricopeptide (TPR) repeat protein